MVISAAKHFVAQEDNVLIQTPKESSNGTSNGYRKICPRCDAKLRINYTEPECLQCGYVDYAYTPTHHNGAKKSIISTATRDVLRYVGDFPTLANTLTYVKLRRVRNRVVYGVICPFCSRPMAQSSLSGKRREAREERYKCVDGHRVSLTPGENGALGWK